jgi:hypothetical protein
VQLGRVGVAAATGVSAAGHPLGEGAGQQEAGLGERGDLRGDAGGAGPRGRGGRHVVIFAAGFRCLAPSRQYKSCMGTAETAASTGWWRPSPGSPQAAAFARKVVPLAAPGGRERATCLLWAAGKAAGYAASLGLGLVPEVALHPPVIERFARCAPGVSGVARRPLRTNLRFLARRAVPQLCPQDVPLPRERCQAPYAAAEISGFLALAGAQPTAERRMRATGLACLGAGAGLIRGDLRDVRGRDVIARSGGLSWPSAARGHGRFPSVPAPTPRCWPLPGAPGPG